MQVDLSSKPYGSRFDSSKQYTMALFKPDYPLQAAELTEVQQMFSHSMSNFGDSLFEEGNVQSGMGYRINRDVIDLSGGTHDTITVEEGYVYLGGKIRKFNEQTIEFNSEGEFNVQVKLEQTITTPEEDNSLLDHTLGVPTYLSEGADRLKEVVVLTSNDPVGKDIYKFLDGGLTNQLQRPGMSKINDVLAERTFDESGSYVVEGLDLKVEPTSKSNTVYEVINPGRAYVRGYQITKATPTKIEVPKSLGTQDVQGEVFYYDNVARSGVLGNASVKSVNRVTSQVRVSRERVNRGAVRDSKDALKNTPVISIARVWEEDIDNQVTKEYVQGVDYNLTGGKDIDWSPTGDEPSPGSSYFVTYVFNDVMTENIDYKVDTRLSNGEVVTVIDFNEMTGTIPVNNTAVQVDYTYYLAREDLIVMDQYGNITVKQGEYSAFNRTVPPLHNDPYTLILGSVKLYPNSDVGSVASTSVKTVDMSEIRKLIARVRNIEFNEAMNALDEDSILGTDPSALRGIFSDSFVDMSRGDTGHPDFNAEYMPSQLAVTSPTVKVGTPRLVFNPEKSTAVINNKTISAPYTEVLSIRQPSATGTMNINPYKVFDAPATMELDPSSDSWIEDVDRGVVEGDEINLGGITKYDVLHLKKYVEERRFDTTRGRDNWLSIRQKEIAEALGLEVYDDGTTNFIEGDLTERSAWGYYNNIQGGRSSTFTMYNYKGLLVDRAAETLEEAAKYMRQIEVTFTGENFKPNEDNIELIFDSKIVPVTPSSGYERGTLTGTIKADSEGRVEGTFIIPEGVETGTREVVLQAGDNVAHSTFESTGLIHTSQVVRDTYNISTSNYDTRNNPSGGSIRLAEAISRYKADPLAQTFQFLSNRTISSVDLFFETKDISEGVLVQVRDVPHSGMPGDIIYAEEFIKPSEINLSSDGSVATRVTFKDPVQCVGGKEYAVVLMSNSDEYEMFISTVGEDDLITGETLNTNPYGAGMLLSSSNTSAWTTHQSSDLKFNLYTTQFEEDSIAYFDVMEDIDANEFLLLKDYINPENTGIRFEYRMVGKSESEGTTLDSKEWVEVGDLGIVKLTDNIRYIEFRAILKARYNTTPMINKDSLLVIFQTYGTSASYIGRTVNSTDAPFNTVRVRLDALSDPATSTVVRYSTDGGDTWNNFTVEPEAVNIGGGFYELFWEETVAEGNQSFDSIKYRIDMETSTNFVRPLASLLRTSTTLE